MAAAGMAARSTKANVRGKVACCFIAALLELRRLRRGAHAVEHYERYVFAPSKGDAIRRARGSCRNSRSNGCAVGLPARSLGRVSEHERCDGLVLRSRSRPSESASIEEDYQ